MKNSGEVNKLPRRRDAALAAPYKSEEYVTPPSETKISKEKRFTSKSLTNKYFKL